MTNSKYNAHTLPLFYNSKILPLTKIILYDKLKFMHAINYGYMIPSFANVWNKNENREMERQLRNDDLFQIPPPRCEFFKKIPLYSLPFEWNNIGDLRFQANPITFSFALKNTLFEQVYSEIDLAD
jgi:hypothetical protein